MPLYRSLILWAIFVLLPLRALAARIDAIAPEITDPHPALGLAGPCAAAPRSGVGNVLLYRHYTDGINKDQNPRIAAAFLDDTHFQTWAQSRNADGFSKMFAHAGELKDLCGLITDHKWAITLKWALERRGENPLIEEPWKLAEWTRSFVAEADPGIVEQATLFWSTLPKGFCDTRTKNGETGEQWDKKVFGERAEIFRIWAQQRRKEILARVPRTPGDVAANKNQLNEIGRGLSKDEWNGTFEELQKSSVLVDTMAEAAKRLKEVKDPKLQAKFANAKNAKNVEGALGSLGEFFDGLGGGSRDLNWARPAAASQKFTAGDRAMLATLLNTGLRREIAETQMGDRVLGFYKAYPLQLSVRDIPEAPGAIGVYLGKDREIVFNEKFVSEYIKTNNLSVKDLLTDGKSFTPLVQQLAPLFVHEAGHQMQHMWREKNGVPDWYSHNPEMESMNIEALYVAEKMRDPKYLQFLKDNQAHSVLAGESLRKGLDIMKSPNQFRQGIRTGNYPAVLSLDGTAGELMDRYSRSLEHADLALARQAKLSWVQRAWLEQTGADSIPDGVYPTKDKLIAAIATMKPSMLRKAQLENKAERDKAPGYYAQLKKHYDDSFADLDSRAFALNATSELAVDRVGGKEPPPPGARSGAAKAPARRMKRVK